MMQAQTSPFEGPKKHSSSENLPAWDLTDFYKSIQDPKIDQDIKDITARCKDFATHYQGKFLPNQFSASQAEANLLAKAIREYEAIEESMGKLISYAFLTYVTHLNSPEPQQFYQKIQEVVTAESVHLLFLTLDINKLSEELLREAYKNSSDLSHYEPWIKVVRLYQDHQLEPEIEKLFLEKSLTSHNA